MKRNILGIIGLVLVLTAAGILLRGLSDDAFELTGLACPVFGIGGSILVLGAISEPARDQRRRGFDVLPIARRDEVKDE